MKKVAKNLFILLFLGLYLIFNAHQVSATSVKYHAYKYGTHQTSMAVGYYAQPAQIVADDGEYLVTMTIRTKKSLSPWPVKVISIAGQSPLNVVKTRHGSDYDYRYSFKVASLKNEVSSKIKIDVPKVYRATHMISFSFDQAALPKLTGKKSESVKRSKQQMSNSKADNGIADAELIAQAKKQSQTAAAKERQLAHDRLLLNKQNQQANERNQKMFYYTILGGTISTLTLLAVAVLVILKIRKDRKSDKR